MSNEVSLDSKEPSSWDYFYETASSVQDRVGKAVARFLDFVCPQDIVTGRRTFHLTTLEFENSVGAALFPVYKFNYGGAVREKYKRYEEVVANVGKKLAELCPRKGINFEFTVVNNWELDAWSLPGGKIGITLGLLDALEKETRSFDLPPLTFEDKVAAVLSHEIIHTAARHIGFLMEIKIYMATLIKVARYVPLFFARMSSEAEKLQAKIERAFDTAAHYIISDLGTCTTRSHELEADKFGMRLLDCPHAMIWLQHFYQAQKPPIGGGVLKWLSQMTSTKPSHRIRLEELTASKSRL
ncbi:MAG: M48 family metalloprotease [Rhabdochlamydiaceae bacterium]|jgi:predicted Zn-dependent protease